MSNLCWLKKGLIVCFLGGSFVMGDDLTPKRTVSSEQTNSKPIPAVPVPPKDANEFHTGLTPRVSGSSLKNPVILAQKESRVKRDGLPFAPAPQEMQNESPAPLESVAVLPVTPEPPKPAVGSESPFANSVATEPLVKQGTRPSPPKVDIAPILVAAKEPIAPNPMIAATDPLVLSELDRLSAEIKAMKKDIPKKPDTKKAWSTPKVAGRVFIDSVNVMDQDDQSQFLNPAMKNSAGFREVRLGVSGNGFDSFDYKIEFGFTGKSGTVDLIDNWIGAKNIPLFGYVRAGHFKPETGLYYPMSTNDVSLMEYTTSASAFGLGRRIGVSSENTFAKDRVRLFTGVFQSGTTNQARYLQEDNQGQVFNLRLSAAPIYEQEGKRVLHVGGHWSYVGTDTGSGKKTSISATPGSFSYLDSSMTTGSFDSDHYNRGGLEFAYQNGPGSIRSEFFAGSYDAYRTSQTRNVYGAYVEAGWFLTGEHRSYDLKKGGFGAPKVKHNFHPFKCGDCNLVDGLGAWQVVAQWSYLDLSDWRQAGNARVGGYQNDLTLGLSWFWTPSLRWVFEYVHSMQNVGDNHLKAEEDIFGTTIRVNF